jgi:elongation factor Ts
MVMTISPAQVKELRDRTNAGMMDCKRALEAASGDFEKAIDWLRTKGLAGAAKKADRVAAEGLILARVEGDTGLLLEINSETDFVARNETFKKFADQVVATAMSCSALGRNIDDLLTQKGPTGVSLADFVKENIATIGENLVVRRWVKVKTEGLLETYLHGEGRIGVMVELVGSGIKTDAAKTLAKDLCLHIAAMNPIALSRDEVAPEILQKEREILKAKNLEQGKKPEMIEKIVEGQINKFLAENCLVEQAFVKNPDLKVKDYVASIAKAAGGDLAVKQFIRFELGEGVQKKQDA